MVTTKERSCIAASISAVAAIWLIAPAVVQVSEAAFGVGTSPTTSATTASARSPKGRPKRKRMCVAPVVPRRAVRPFWVALRNVCAVAAASVKATQSQDGALTSRTIREPEHVFVEIGKVWASSPNVPFGTRIAQDVRGRRKRKKKGRAAGAGGPSPGRKCHSKWHLPQIVHAGLYQLCECARLQSR